VKAPTPLQALQPLLHVLLPLLALALLLELHLLAELLALTLAALLLRASDPSLLVQQALPDALHVRIGLDHLREVVWRPGEG
jgi:hypothetical protein